MTLIYNIVSIKNNCINFLLYQKDSILLHHDSNEAIAKTTKMKNNWALFENGFIHTDRLSKEDAEEMLERHSRIFEDIEWYIMELPYKHEYPYA